MVGMDAQQIRENSIGRDCLCDPSSNSCAHPNENVLFHFQDSGTPTAPVAAKGNLKGSALCPITPTPRRENGTSTPLSVESPQSPNVDAFNSATNQQVEASDLHGSPRTPNEGVFDSFAPGPDEMLLAPICKKLVKESRRIVVRRLNFEEIEDVPASKDEIEDVPECLTDKLLLDSVYGALLEAIILKQSEEFFAENQSLELDGLQMPASPKPFMGVAETCPGAPVKAAPGKSRNVDVGLCRKLEF